MYGQENSETDFRTVISLPALCWSTNRGTCRDRMQTERQCKGSQETQRYGKRSALQDSSLRVLSTIVRTALCQEGRRHGLRDVRPLLRELKGLGMIATG